MPVLQEQNIPKNSRSLRFRFIGATGQVFTLTAGGDDFSDNREKAAKVVAKSRGEVFAVIKGESPDAITGSLTVPFFTENNGKAAAFLDVIDGKGLWALESTGKIGLPYVTPYCITMEVTHVGAAEDGGDMVRTYEKTYFEPSVKDATDMSTISVNFFAYGAVTGVGPS